MKRIHNESGMLVDPHTAIGIASAEARAEPGIPTITLATAHPAKFPDAVKQATGVHPALPDHVADLFDRQERIVNLPNDLQAVEAFVASCH
jgi:threonine synthase